MKSPSKFIILFIFLTVWVWPQSVASSQTTPPISPTEPITCSASPAVLGNPITKFAPDYPKRALKAKIQGNVVLDLTVSETGKVVSISVLGGDPELSREAAKAVREWEYLPSEEEHSAKRHGRVTLVFRIDDRGKPVVGAEFPSPPHPGFCSADPTVKSPRALYSPDPNYSEQARRDKAQGFCVLSLVVGPDGLPADIRIKRPLGHGLDEKAMEAVQQWKFEPARKNGVPVPVRISVQVFFRYY